MLEALKYIAYLFTGANMSKDAELLDVEFSFRSVATNVLRVSPPSESSMVIIVVDE